MLVFLTTTISTDVATGIADWIAPLLEKLRDIMDPGTETDSPIPLWTTIWIVILVLVLMITISDMVVSFLLIPGAWMQRPGFLIPWMVVTVSLFIGIIYI